MYVCMYVIDTLNLSHPLLSPRECRSQAPFLRSDWMEEEGGELRGRYIGLGKPNTREKCKEY